MFHPQLYKIVLYYLTFLILIIIIEIEDSVENKPIIYKNLIYNDIRPDRFDLGLLEKALEENYEKDANACDNIKDYDNNEGDNNNESEFIKSYKSFLATFDEVFERDYYNC